MKLAATALGTLCAVHLSSGTAHAQARLPILDMHLHARTADYYGPPPQFMCVAVERMPFWDPAQPLEAAMEAYGRSAPCKEPLSSPMTDTDLLRQTVAIMERHNVIGVLGGQPALLATWMAAAPARFIPGLDFRVDRAIPSGIAATNRAGGPLSPDSLRALHRRGAVAVLGEVMNQYAGIAPDDPRMEPYWAVAEELDMPVGIHIGGGAPGEAYIGSPGFRARLQSALTLEEVLVKHPRLRVYIMHAGYPLVDDLRALLFSHPQVYVEVSMAVNVEPRAAFYQFLREIVAAGYGERVMFGSDQIIWPGLIEAAITSIQQAPFLNDKQKRDIFYNNAARFLRLTPEDIARHHRM